MAKLGESKILFILVILFIASVPLAISNQFFSANDLVKSSSIFILGGLTVVMFFLLFIYRLSADKEEPLIYFHAGKLDLSVLLLLSSVSISTLFSLRPFISFLGTYERHLGLIIYIYLTVLYFISGFVLNDSERRKGALQIIEIISVIISLYAFLQYLDLDFLNFQPGSLKRPGSFLGHCVFLGGFLALSFPFSALNSSEKKSKSLKFFFPSIILLAIIVTGTRSAYIAVFVQIVVFVLVKRKQIMLKTTGRKGLFIIVSVSAVFILFLFVFVSKDAMLYQRIATGIDFDNPRLVLWKDASNVFFKFPFTGPGIAMFPAAFEEFYSNSLRFREANVVFDHAHNNYLQTLFTMGLIGLIAYLMLIYNSFRTAVRIMKSSAAANVNRNISFAVILMLTGYCAYGFTNFDDISILFLFFILLSVLRSLDLRKSEVKLRGFKSLYIVISTIIIILTILHIPYTLNILNADRYYKQAFVAYGKGEFKKALNLNNEAIVLNPNCSAYRFLEASEVVNFCIDDSIVDQKSKNSLLKQVENEIEKVKNDLYYVNYCNGILSMALFEEGRNLEAENLMTEVLAKDSVNLNYRIMLARYFLKSNRLEETKRSLDIITLMRPNEISSILLSAMYYWRKNDKEKAVLYANELLLADPKNKIAAEIRKEFEVK